MALRLSTARAHGYPPFTLVTGLLPTLPSDLQQDIVVLPEGEVTAAQEKDYVNQLLQVVAAVRRVAQARMTKLELQLHRRLRQQEKSNEHTDTLFHYRIGD